MNFVPHCDGTKPIYALMVGRLSSGKTETIYAIWRALDPDHAPPIMKIRIDDHGTLHLTPVTVEASPVTFLDTWGIDQNKDNWQDFTIRAMIDGKVPENWHKDNTLEKKNLKEEGREIDSIIIPIASSEDVKGEAVKKLKEIIKIARDYEITPIVVVTYLSDEDQDELKSFWESNLGVPKDHILLLGWNNGMGSCEIDRQASEIYRLTVKAANETRIASRTRNKNCTPITSPSLLEYIISALAIVLAIGIPTIVLCPCKDFFWRKANNDREKREDKKDEEKEEDEKNGDEKKEKNDGEGKGVVSTVPEVDFLQEEGEQKEMNENKTEKGKNGEKNVGKKKVVE